MKTLMLTLSLALLLAGGAWGHAWLDSSRAKHPAVDAFETFYWKLQRNDLAAAGALVVPGSEADLALLEKRMKGGTEATQGPDVLGLWAIARAKADLGTLLSRGAREADGDELLKAAAASAKEAKAAEAAATKESAPEMLLRDEMGFGKDQARVEKLLGIAEKSDSPR